MAGPSVPSEDAPFSSSKRHLHLNKLITGSTTLQLKIYIALCADNYSVIDKAISQSNIGNKWIPLHMGTICTLDEPCLTNYGGQSSLPSLSKQSSLTLTSCILFYSGPTEHFPFILCCDILVTLRGNQILLIYVETQDVFLDSYGFHSSAYFWRKNMFLPFQKKEKRVLLFLGKHTCSLILHVRF